ncbi:hypothetical protein IMSHALPRED_007937, partial [Imshaugia aleurites]
MPRGRANQLPRRMNERENLAPSYAEDSGSEISRPGVSGRHGAARPRGFDPREGTSGRYTADPPRGYDTHGYGYGDSDLDDAELSDSEPDSTLSGPHTAGPHDYSRYMGGAPRTHERHSDDSSAFSANDPLSRVPHVPRSHRPRYQRSISYDSSSSSSSSAAASTYPPSNPTHPHRRPLGSTYPELYNDSPPTSPTHPSTSTYAAARAQHGSGAGHPPVYPRGTARDAAPYSDGRTAERCYPRGRVVTSPPSRYRDLDSPSLSLSPRRGGDRGRRSYGEYGG